MRNARIPHRAVDLVRAGPGLGIEHCHGGTLTLVFEPIPLANGCPAQHYSATHEKSGTPVSGVTQLLQQNDPC